MIKVLVFYLVLYEYLYQRKKKSKTSSDTLWNGLTTEKSAQMLEEYKKVFI